MHSKEKEIRFRATKGVVEKINNISKVLEEPQKQVDVTLGYDGFNSLQNYGYVCRVRQKGSKIWMEVKNRKQADTFYETKVDLVSFENGIDFFKTLGMVPYLYMNRTRTIRFYDGLKIFIDDIELLGLFVEIEYQDVENPEQKLDEFISKIGVNDYKEEPLYGDIFKERFEVDPNFKNQLQEKLNAFLKSL